MTDKGFTDSVKGKVKEVTGDITNNQELKAEGLVDQGKGKLKKAAGDIKDAAEEIKDKVKEQLDNDK
ncbi:CsbD family protein [Vagococcus sp. DIV0080]|uniref:CsbD family protein n=1 Tax=Candidatus Vagococcus giribetii TaxID=2230876 RepID=A0ABS3HT45_9ENTE|nr:CsbD family protein [Vagococcus sp. DIV0080]MBO0476895.1 CsbD family protein [Vagococcus sp. DIV0080]